MNRKKKFLWEKNSFKNKGLKSDFQKVQGQTNEKLLVVYAFFETEIFLSMMEDVVKVKLSNDNLETIKKLELLERYLNYTRVHSSGQFKKQNYFLKKKHQKVNLLL